MPDMDEIAAAAVTARQYKALTHMAGLTDAGVAMCIDKADLHYVWDTMGRMYLDLTSGGGALPMGWHHLVNEAVWADPAASYVHVSRYGESCLQVQADYAEAISTRMPEVDGEPQQVMFTNSGEQAIEIARQIAGARSIARVNIKPVDPDTYAPLDTGRAQKLCEQGVEQGCAIVVDERLTGYGRLGSFRAGSRYDLDRFAKDTITVFGESGGGGIPFGAVVAPRHLWARHGPMRHRHHGGNPIACSAGLRILRLQDGVFYEHVRDLSDTLEAACENLRSQFPTLLLNHRGRGMLRAIKVNPSVDETLMHKALLNNGIIVDLTPDDPGIALTPPLIMTETAITQAFDQIAAALVDYERHAPANP